MNTCRYFVTRLKISKMSPAATAGLLSTKAPN